ncbi:hypothetical protein CAEBREN_08417 [Caenorhabditis brenneri]|uniref:Uncharacterized protein n=1 Tax=Caenorhabditis brenneri TaxID=135651 RepID=G0PBT8_CAEBE|nr:hypothetical protein CAEBREN_08417 [Caenorhabditis brenneri]
MSCDKDLEIAQLKAALGASDEKIRVLREENRRLRAKVELDRKNREFAERQERVANEERRRRATLPALNLARRIATDVYAAQQEASDNEKENEMEHK